MTETDFANRLSSFMSEYLPHDRNVSKHTLASYKVAFIDFIIFYVAFQIIGKYL